MLAPCEQLASISELMRGFDGPWYVAGGWAIDLFLGRSTRAHSDVDIAILRRDRQDDFDNVLEVLKEEQRDWLRGARMQLSQAESSRCRACPELSRRTTSQVLVQFQLLGVAGPKPGMNSNDDSIYEQIQYPHIVS